VVPFGFREHGAFHYLVQDARGAVCQVLTASGVVVWRATYDAFGVVNAEGSIRQPFRLMGQYEDQETGLTYNGARYYAPWMRVYVSPDPRWDEPRAHRYAYAANDPLNRVDPSGCMWSFVGITLSLAAQAANIYLAAMWGIELGGRRGKAVPLRTAVHRTVPQRGAYRWKVPTTWSPAAPAGAATEGITEHAERGDGVCQPCPNATALPPPLPLRQAVPASAGSIAGAGYSSEMSRRDAGVLWGENRMPSGGLRGSQVGSVRAARSDLRRISPELAARAVRAAEQNQVPVPLLFALFSRESQWGATLDASGLGDRGHAFGIGQVDLKTSGVARDTILASGTASETHMSMSAELLHDKFRRVSTKHPEWTEHERWRGAVAAYNYGVKSVRTLDGIDGGTTGNDYSGDVMERARTFHGALRTQDDPIAQTAPAPASDPTVNPGKAYWNSEERRWVPL
jgi:RHS repeat-associated protein